MSTLVLLDIQQDFSNVWYVRLLHKLERPLPGQTYLIIKSYLSDRYFQVKVEDELSVYHKIRARVPQGSVLGHIVYH